MERVESQNVGLFLFMSFLNQALMYVAILYLPYYFETTISATPIEAGAVITPMMAGLLLADNISARIVIRGGSPKVLGISSFLLTSGCMTLLSAMGTNDDYLKGILLVAAVGFSLGINMPLSNTNVQKLSQREELGRMTSLVMFSKNMGRVVSSAVFGVIFVYVGEVVSPLFAIAAIVALLGAVAMTFLHLKTPDDSK